MNQTVRPWQAGDKAVCRYAGHPRRWTEPCGHPVAVVETPFHQRDAVRVRTAVVCQRHLDRAMKGFPFDYRHPGRPLANRRSA